MEELCGRNPFEGSRNLNFSYDSKEGNDFKGRTILLTENETRKKHLLKP